VPADSVRLIDTGVEGCLGVEGLGFAVVGWEPLAFGVAAGTSPMACVVSVGANWRLRALSAAAVFC